MISDRLKQYLVNRDIQPSILLMKSRKTGEEVSTLLIPHPISGEQYNELRNLVPKGSLLCAATLSHLVLVEKDLVGKTINLLDLLDQSNIFLEGKTVKGLKVELVDLSKFEKQLILEEDLDNPSFKKDPLPKKGTVRKKRSSPKKE